MRFAQVFSNRQDASPLLREISSGKLPEHLDPLLEIESFTEALVLLESSIVRLLKKSFKPSR